MKKQKALFLLSSLFLILPSCKKGEEKFVIDTTQKLVTALSQHKENLKMEGTISLVKVNQKGGEDESVETVREGKMKIAYSSGLYYSFDFFSIVPKELFYSKSKDNKVISNELNYSNSVNGTNLNLSFDEYINPLYTLKESDFRKEYGYLSYSVDNSETQKNILNNIHAPFKEDQCKKLSIESDSDNNIYFVCTSKDFTYVDSDDPSLSFDARYEIFYTLDTTIKKAYVLESKVKDEKSEKLENAFKNLYYDNYTVFRNKTTVDSIGNESRAETVFRYKFDGYNFADFVSKKGVGIQKGDTRQNRPPKAFTFDENNNVTWGGDEWNYITKYRYRPDFHNANSIFFSSDVDDVYYLNNLNIIKNIFRYLSTGDKDYKDSLIDTCYFIKIDLHNLDVYDITFSCLVDGKYVNFYDVYKNIRTTKLDEFGDIFDDKL